MMPEGLDCDLAWVTPTAVLLWRCGPDGRCFYANGACLSSGSTLSELQGETWKLSLHPDDEKAATAILAAHLLTHQPFTRNYRLRRFDGSYRGVIERGSPVQDAKGEFGGFVIEAMQIEESGMAPPSDLDDFFEMSLDHVCVAGFDGYFKRLNKSWTQTLGWSVSELMSTPSIKFVHPEDRAATLAARGNLHDGNSIWHL